MLPRQRWEFRRKLVHMSGVIPLGLAVLVGQPLAVVGFFLISLAFLTYGSAISRFEQSHHSRARRFESWLRDAALRFEHERRAPLLFQGLIWYYFSSGLALLLFPWAPVNIAVAACLFLAIGDGFSTILGVHGTRKLVGPKTWEGTLAFASTAFLAGLLFLPPWLSALGAIVAAATELIPALHIPGRPWNKAWDDNLLIPIVSGLFMTLAASAAGLL